MKKHQYISWLGFFVTMIGFITLIDYFLRGLPDGKSSKIYDAMFMFCFLVGPLLIFAGYIFKVRKMKYYRSGYDFPMHGRWE